METLKKGKSPLSELSLLTVNLHCLEEENIEEKQKLIINQIIDLDIDIVFLQEVAQYQNGDILLDKIKASNYGYQLQEMLEKEGEKYFYYYEPIKYSFNKYDEGLGFLSKYPIENFKGSYISKCRDYSDWKSRKMISGEVTIQGKHITLVNTHMGWTDEKEVFEDQIDLLLSEIDNNNLVLYAGDFNVRPMSEEYKYILSKGLLDTFQKDQEMFLTATFPIEMDVHKEVSRIDYFFTNQELDLLERKILFTDDRVSDHYGVYIKVKL